MKFKYFKLFQQALHAYGATADGSPFYYGDNLVFPIKKNGKKYVGLFTLTTDIDSLQAWLAMVEYALKEEYKL